MNIALARIASCIIVEIASCIIVEGAGCCGAAQATTEGQDKKAHIAAWTVGCFVSAFSDLLHIASYRRDVRVFHFANDFSEYRTSRVQR